MTRTPCKSTPFNMVFVAVAVAVAAVVAEEGEVEVEVVVVAEQAMVVARSLTCRR